jgi:hypothetical protein
LVLLTAGIYELIRSDGSDAILYVPSLIKIGFDTEKSVRGYAYRSTHAHTHTHTHTHTLTLTLTHTHTKLISDA